MLCKVLKNLQSTDKSLLNVQYTRQYVISGKECFVLSDKKVLAPTEVKVY